MIYIDLDGVLADFDGWLVDFLGIGYTELEVQDLIQAKASECFLKSKVIESNKYLLSLGEFRILTALPKLSLYKDSVFMKLKRNKLKWCEMLGIPKSKVIMVGRPSEKVLYCEPGDILYDDYEKTVDSWNSASGIGFLVEAKKHSSKYYTKGGIKL